MSIYSFMSAAGNPAFVHRTESVAATTNNIQRSNLGFFHEYTAEIYQSISDSADIGVERQGSGEGDERQAAACRPTEKIAQPQGRRRLGGAEEGRHEQYLHKRLGGAPGNGDRLPEIRGGDETRGARE
jgi:hypothetical protein